MAHGDASWLLAAEYPIGPTVWWIGPTVTAAMLLYAASSWSRGGRWLGPPVIAATLAGGWNLIAWAILRRVMRGHAGTFESAFIQLSMASIATFLFAVALLIARRFMSRRG